MAGNWIAGAIKHKGSLTKQAESAGMSLDAFCAKKDLSTKTKKRCSLRNTLKSFKK